MHNAELKALVLGSIYDEIGSRDIAVVYVDVGAVKVEAEFFYPALGRYQVAEINRSDTTETGIGRELGRRALDYWDANV